MFSVLYHGNSCPVSHSFFYYYYFVLISLCSSSQQPRMPLITTTRKDALMGRVWFSQVRLSVRCFRECCYLFKGWSSLHLSNNLVFFWFSQRYVKYFERVLTYFNGEIQPARRYPPDFSPMMLNFFLFIFKRLLKLKII